MSYWKNKIRPLDIVTIDSGAVGMVVVGDESHCSIKWFGMADEKNAWWKIGESGLRVIDNLPAFLTDELKGLCAPSHPANPYGKDVWR